MQICLFVCTPELAQTSGVMCMETGSWTYSDLTHTHSGKSFYIFLQQYISEICVYSDNLLEIKYSTEEEV